MKKQTIILAGIVMLLGIVPDLYAQQQVPVSATVLSQLSLTTQSGVDFANVGQVTSPSLTVTGSGMQSSGINTGTPTLGHITVTSGGNGANVHVSWASKLTLTVNGGTNPNDKMDYNPTVYGDNSGTLGSASDLSTGGATTADVTLSSTGSYDIWLGGTLTGYDSGGTISTLSSTQSSGTYSGDINVTITYN